MNGGCAWTPPKVPPRALRLAPPGGGHGCAQGFTEDFGAFGGGLGAPGKLHQKTYASSPTFLHHAYPEKSKSHGKAARERRELARQRQRQRQRRLSKGDAAFDDADDSGVAFDATLPPKLKVSRGGSWAARARGSCK